MREAKNSREDQRQMLRSQNATSHVKAQTHSPLLRSRQRRATTSRKRKRSITRIRPEEQKNS
jgi:hypothetical protein